MIQQRYTHLFNEIHKIEKASKKGKKFLDVGCGLSIDLMRWANRGYDVVGLDINIKSLSLIPRPLAQIEHNLLCASALCIPLSSKSIDVVQCSHVIEHLASDSKAMFEINRVLRLNGLLYLGVPNIDNLMTRAKFALRFEKPYTDQTHLREYNRNRALQLVKASGFRVIEYSFSGFLPPLPFPLFQQVWVFLKFFLQGFNRALNWLAKIIPQFAASIDIVAIKTFDAE